MSASLLKRRFFEAARQMLVPDDVAYVGAATFLNLNNIKLIISCLITR